MSYTLNLDTGIARTVDLLWMPVRIAAVTGQIYWATWHQVFQYPRGDE